MSDLAVVAKMLRAVAELNERDDLFARRYREIRGNEIRSTGEGFTEPRRGTEVFLGGELDQGAGVAAYLTARRGDHRLVGWTVEVWIGNWQDEALGSAIVKGEIEVAVDDDMQTIFDVQRTVHDVPAVIDAVRECADLVAAYAESDLFAGPPPTPE